MQTNFEGRSSSVIPMSTAYGTRGVMVTCRPDSTTAVLPATSAETGAGTQLLANVLANRPLWNLITSFMKGYPLAVFKFYRESDTAALQSACEKWHGKQAFLIDNLTRRGVLPHLAIAANDPEMFKALIKLSKNHQYQRDPKLSFSKAM